MTAASVPAPAFGTPSPVRVFVSSPSQLRSERLLVIKVCRMLGSALNIPIEPLLWEGGGPKNPDVPAFFPDLAGAGAQAVIDQQCWDDLHGYDIYLGMIWHRMGTPTKDPSSGKEWRSGTEAEYRLAVQKRRETGRPSSLMFYQKTAPPKKLKDVVPNQLNQVHDFVKELSGPTGGLFLPFSTTAELEQFLSTHLKIAVQRVLAARTPTPPDPQPDPVTFWEGRPDSLGDTFVGRDAELETIAQRFAHGGPVVISGGAGIGKSQLAAEYADACGLPGFWTPAGDSVDRTLAALAPRLGLDPGNAPDEEIAATVQAKLHSLPADMLWVVDNLGDLSLVRDLARAAAPLRLLVTTRDSRTQLLPRTLPPAIPLKPLEPHPAVALLCSRNSCDPGDPALPQIAKLVGGLPLALEMLAVRLGTGSQTPKSVLQELQHAPNRLALSAFQQRLREAGAAIARPESVFAVLAGALTELPADVREAIAPLGYVADAPVPIALVTALAGCAGEDLDFVLEACRKHSILLPAAGAVTLHALTAAAIAATNPTDALETALRRAYNRLNAINEADPVALRAEVPHHEKILAEARRALTGEDARVLSYANELAIGYGALGRNQEVVRLDEETLAVRQRVLGPHHPDTLSSRNNLAVGYLALGRTEEAVQLLEQVLAVRERIQGPEHPDPVTTRNNLAEGYRALGRIDDAVRLEDKNSP